MRIIIVNRKTGSHCITEMYVLLKQYYTQHKLAKNAWDHISKHLRDNNRTSMAYVLCVISNYHNNYYYLIY